MSPEQACGDKSIDARTDQYSLAVVGYRMLAGKLPFEGESTRAMLYQQLVAEPPPIATTVPGVPNGLANAIQRAMSKEPAERFANMLEFAAMLDSEGPGTAAVPAAPKPTARPRRRGLVPIVAVAAVVVIGGAWWLATPAAPAKVTPPPVVANAPPPAAQPPPAATNVPLAPPPPTGKSAKRGRR